MIIFHLTNLSNDTEVLSSNDPIEIRKGIEIMLDNGTDISALMVLLECRSVSKNEIESK